tara:strand:+ start:204 stop:815 length:612 start_codon:yes stop_codon:yes gene_type:complete
MIQRTTTPVFGSAIYCSEIDIDEKKIVSLIDAPIKSSQVGTEYRGKDSYYVLEQKKFKSLKNAILKEFHHYASEVLQYSNKFKITTSWFTQLDKGEQGQPHNHNNCFISGVLYLKTYENSGDIVFKDYRDSRFMLFPKQYNLYNSKDWVYKPTNKMILFFPSSLYHEIEENKSEYTRHSLAFNFIPIGTLGDITSDSHLVSKY